MIKAAEDASAAERSFLLLERRADAEREENRCLGAQKDLRISDLETQVCDVEQVFVPGGEEGNQGHGVCPVVAVAAVVVATTAGNVVFFFVSDARGVFVSLKSAWAGLIACLAFGVV